MKGPHRLSVGLLEKNSKTGKGLDRGDYAGACESAERAFRNFPEDTKLNQVRANLTAKAADFVHARKVTRKSNPPVGIGAFSVRVRPLQNHS
jgi:hypothetical protein